MLERLNRFTARWLFVLLAGSIAAGWWQSAALAPAAFVNPYLLAIMIFAVASTLDPEAFRRAGREPGLWLRSFALSYVVFPAMAWAVGQLLFPADPLVRLGLLLLALVPAANTASVYTGLARGDVAFALTGIALGNILLPLVLMAFFAAQGAGTIVSPAMVWRTLLLFVILPTALGVAAGSRLQAKPVAADAPGAAGARTPARVAPVWRQAAPIVARLCVMAIMLLNAAALRAQMNVRLDRIAILAAAVLLMETTMYALTRWWAAHRLPERPAEGKALCFLHATRNTALAIALASTALGPQAALPAMTAFVVQEPLAAAVAAQFSARFRNQEQALEA
ncbi:MAG: hypothetical protein DIU82_08445 [Bacillota bacterium]|nr:MAG: hypothetical protein DIU82_08445 [Bacillota bacterium]